MGVIEVSRRRFAMVSGAGLLARNAVPAATGALTARQVVERIQKNSGVTWKAETVDTFKAGNPDTAVKGIATTGMATAGVLRRAAESGKNLVITQEPLFYSRAENTQTLSNDAVYLAKQAAIENIGVVVWRFCDHWRMRKPDGNITGLESALGWRKYKAPAEEGLYILPGAPLAALVKELQGKLKATGVRVVGEPQGKVSRVGLVPGSSSLSAARRVLSSADVVVAGKVFEWEGVEYVQDAVAAGMNKAMIVLGHLASIEPGMNECAAWLRTFIPEVPVQFIPAGDPYWRPRS